MQPKKLTFEETLRDETVRPDQTCIIRKQFKVEPIEDGLIVSISRALLIKWSSGARFLPGIDVSEELSVAEAEALIKALTEALDEVTRPVSAVYLDKNCRAAPGVPGLSELQGKSVPLHEMTASEQMRAAAKQAEAHAAAEFEKAFPPDAGQ